MTRFAYERVAAGMQMLGLFEIGTDLPLARAIDDESQIAECSVDGEWRVRSATYHCGEVLRYERAGVHELREFVEQLPEDELPSRNGRRSPERGGSAVRAWGCSPAGSPCGGRSRAPSCCPWKVHVGHVNLRMPVTGGAVHASSCGRPTALRRRCPAPGHVPWVRWPGVSTGHAGGGWGFEHPEGLRPT